MVLGKTKREMEVERESERELQQWVTWGKM